MNNPEVKIGEVFYRIEPTDYKYYTRECRVCEGNKVLTVNGVTFPCPMCRQEKEDLRVNGFLVRRYRVFSITYHISDSDWKYTGEKSKIRYGLYHKRGKGYSSYNSTHKKVDVGSDMLSDGCVYFNCHNPTKYTIDSCWYSDYKLAVKVAEKLTSEQIDKVREYNEANNTDYPLPVFSIENDKKSN